VGNILLIAGVNDPVIADYAIYARRIDGRRISVVSNPGVCANLKEREELHSASDFSATEYLSAHSRDRISGVVLFLTGNSTKDEQELLEKIAEIVAQKRVECVCVISSFHVHFGDTQAASAEASVVNQLKDLSVRIVVFRPGHVISPTSRVNETLQKYRFLAPVVPNRFKSCCVEGDELFATVERELGYAGRWKRRTFTLLGANRPWKTLLAQKSSERQPHALGKIVAVILRLLLIGHLAGLLFNVFARWIPRLRAFNFDTLYPKSFQELLALYNKYNYQNVKIVGYNNGVVHFGQSYPEKTVVSTIHCNRKAYVQEDRARFDGGVTIRQAMEVLRAEGKELHVIPNYSYVCLGTAYFIPIHGSASLYSTVGETIEKVLLYDPKQDRFVSATREKPAFGQYAYNLATEVLLLRLTVRVREKVRYFVKVLKLANPSSADVLSYFRDKSASNVEVRKSGASSQESTVRLYYTEGTEGDSTTLELPRDTLGSLWDRLEANPITSVLFHGLIRRLAHHVELFLSEKDFGVFWETHQKLPLSKIQLRYIKKDELPHSPFREHDCVSADLFMLKKHKKAFETYLRDTLPAARLNPGKHSA
jgi:hypothetical protein